MSVTTGRIAALLFFLSGACGLVYEVVWMRSLALVFGATAPAAAAVLSAFFAGLALGSLLFGGVADRVRRPLVLYAALEAGVGVLAFAMPAVLAGVGDAYVALARLTDPGPHGANLIRLVLAFLALLLPTTLLGGTVPAIARGVVRSERGVGGAVSRLYAANTFGAVAGAVGAGFFLILLVGAREATYLAGALNLAIAGAALLLARREAQAAAAAAARGPGAVPVADPGLAGGATAAPSTSGTGTPGAADAVEPLPSGLARLTLVAAGLAGVTALALEVLWTRALVFYLDNSTHAFTTVLATFLAGIALGSALVARFADGPRARVAAFGAVEALAGLSALLALPALAGSAPVLERLIGATTGEAFFWKWSAMRLLTSMSVMLLPTLLMGMSLPLAVRAYAGGLARLGASVGRVYSANTFGGVAGALLASFVLIPALGVHGGIVVAAGLATLTGAALLLAEPPERHARAVRTALAAGIVAAFAGSAWSLRGGLVLASYKERADGGEVLWYREGVGSTVKVVKDAEGERLLSVDGFPVAGTSLGMHDAQKSLGNLPLLLSGVDRPRVALVGFGVGGASRETLRYDVAEAEVIELVPAVIEAAPWFDDVNHGVLSDARFQLTLADGRSHFLVSERMYDVVTIDATSPKMAGNGSLYTLEFYELVRARLSARGLAVQWLPFHLLSEAEVRMTARTFQAVFPHTTLWLSPLRHHGLLVGTREPLRIDPRALARKLERPGVRAQFAPMGVIEPLDVLSWFVMGEEALADFAGRARLNTDDHPYLEFAPAFSYFLTLRYATRNLHALARARGSVLPLLSSLGETEEERRAFAARVEDRFRATQHSISGDIFFYLGREEEARGEYAVALLIDPGDRNAAHPFWLGRGRR